MRIDRTTTVFFDASCLIAAAGSPAGGSGFLLSLCARSLLVVAVSLPVLIEAEGNLAKKLGPDALARFDELLERTPMVIAQVPGIAERQPYQAIAGVKDDHVVAAAIASRSSYLLTLDKRLAQAVNNSTLSLRAYTPGEFITGVLPAHDEFPALRQSKR